MKTNSVASGFALATAATAITLGEVVVRSVNAVARTANGLSTVMKIANITAKVFQVANVLNNVFNTVKVGDPTADYLNSIMTKSVDTDIEKMWTDSKHGTEQNQEWGATLVNMNGEYKVTLQHPGAGSGSVQATFPTAQRYNKRGKPMGNYYGAFVAIIHTHPYPTAITKGFGFHTGDIIGMREFFQNKNIIQGPMTKPFYLIESGSKRYALVIEDMALAEKFFNETSDEKIQNLFNSGYSKSTKATGQEKMVDGVLNVIGDQNTTGLSLYQTGTDKTNFFKATKN